MGRTEPVVRGRLGRQRKGGGSREGKRGEEI